MSQSVSPPQPSVPVVKSRTVMEKVMDLMLLSLAQGEETFRDVLLRFMPVIIYRLEAYFFDERRKGMMQVFRETVLAVFKKKYKDIPPPELEEDDLPSIIMDKLVRTMRAHVSKTDIRDIRVLKESEIMEELRYRAALIIFTAAQVALNYWGELQ